MLLEFIDLNSHVVVAVVGERKIAQNEAWKINKK